MLRRRNGCGARTEAGGDAIVKLYDILTLFHTLKSFGTGSHYCFSFPPIKVFYKLAAITVLL